jgi:hypothetical protein
VVVLPVARADIRDLAEPLQDEIAIVIEGLGSDPIPDGAVALTARDFRINVGDRHIDYRVEEDQRVVVARVRKASLLIRLGRLFVPRRNP